MHGIWQDLQDNLTLLKRKYNKPMLVAEYSQLKKEVNKIAFTLDGEGPKELLFGNR